MILQVHELVSELKQKITTTETIQLYAVRVHLYKHLAPAGSLYLELKNANDALITTSNVITISSISVANYFHGYVRFLISYPMQSDTSYYFSLKSTGYTYSDSAFIGWCNDFDLKRVESSYSPSSGIMAPLGLEIWGYETISRRGV
jgi:hypothetical protein